ncbi:MAG: tetratricopeptide repeat protein [Acidobacteria bacterium]|nr:tetratricopeptide repeat protein [Acidobacteriota bacterium]
MKKSGQKPRSRNPQEPARHDAPANFLVSRPAAVILLSLLALLAYANSVNGRFVFDDTVIIQGNDSIHGLDSAHLKAIFGQHYWKAVESKGGLYRPVVMLSYAVDYALNGEDPAGYHVMNILIHAFNGILVFFLLEGLFARRMLSLLTALFFVLHPIRTEAVASIVGRAESLSACFVLAAWLLYIRHRKTSRIRWLSLSAAVFVLAVLTKESAFAFVALLPVTDFILGNGRLRETFLKRAVLGRYLAFAAAVALVLLLRYWALGGLAPLYVNPRSNPLAAAPVWPRFLTATNVFGRYLALLLWPINLSADYSYSQIPLVTSIFAWSAALPLACLMLLVAALPISARRYPVLFFSGLVFLLSFVLTSNWIRPIGTIMAERLMYFPALGFNCAAAFLLCAGLSMPRWKTVSAVAAVVLLAGYGLRTIDRNPDWQDHYRLFRSAVAASPHSYLAQSNYAAVLLNEKDDLRGAILHARKALEIVPEDPAAHFTLAQASRRLGDLPGAAEAFKAVVRLAPRTRGGTDALRAQAEVEEAMGSLSPARASYETLREWQPQDVAAGLALSRVYLRLGEREKAKETLEQCRKLAPHSPAVRQALLELASVSGPVQSSPARQTTAPRP